MSGNEFQKDVVGIGVKPVAPQLQRYICHDRRQLGGSLRTCLGRNPGRGPRPYSQDSGRLSGATGGEAHFNGRLSRSTSHPRILHDPNKGLRKSSEHLYQARKRGRCIANASYRRKGKSSTTRLQPLKSLTTLARGFRPTFSEHGVSLIDNLHIALDTRARSCVCIPHLDYWLSAQPYPIKLPGTLLREPKSRLPMALG